MPFPFPFSPPNNNLTIYFQYNSANFLLVESVYLWDQMWWCIPSTWESEVSRSRWISSENQLGLHMEFLASHGYTRSWLCQKQRPFSLYGRVKTKFLRGKAQQQTKEPSIVCQLKLWVLSHWNIFVKFLILIFWNLPVWKNYRSNYLKLILLHKLLIVSDYLCFHIVTEYTT